MTIKVLMECRLLFILLLLQDATALRTSVVEFLPLQRLVWSRMPIMRDAAAACIAGVDDRQTDNNKQQQIALSYDTLCHITI